MKESIFVRNAGQPETGIFNPVAYALATVQVDIEDYLIYPGADAGHFGYCVDEAIYA